MRKFDLGPDAASGTEPVTREALLAHYGRRIEQNASSGQATGRFIRPGGKQADGRGVSAWWPRLPEWIRDPRIQIAELNEKELIKLADEILEHRFVLGEYSPLTTPEGKLDWQSSPTPNIEWRWALNRHQWWCIWGLAHERTHDERYAAAFVDQMLEWVAAHPPPARKNEQSPSWRLMEVGVRMRISWIPCFALFYNSAAFTDDAKMTMLRAIYDHARFLYLFQTSNNHFIRESNGLAYVSATFTEFQEARHWLQESLARLDEALTEQVNPDGSHFELSTGYQTLVISEYQSTNDLIQANGLKLPRHDLAGWLAQMYQMIAFLSRPDGSLPLINDGYLYWKTPYLARAGRALSREDLVYVGTGGQQGIPPAQTSVGLREAGLYIMRSDWGPDAHYLLFDGGPYGGYHGHEDKLSIEVCAFGQTFIADPGCHNYDQADPLRSYFVSSHAHNTLLVDGKSQIRRWHREHLHPKAATDHTDSGPRPPGAVWVSESQFDYVSATYSAGYANFRLRKPRDLDMSDLTKRADLDALPDASSGPGIVRDVTHTRQVLFVKGQQSGGPSPMPDYWVIVDTIEASEPHSYQLLFHTAPGISVMASDVRIGVDGAKDQADKSPPIKSPAHQSTGILLSGKRTLVHLETEGLLSDGRGVSASDAPGPDAASGNDRPARLYLIPADPHKVQVSWRTGSEDPIQGWYSGEFGHTVPVTTVTFECTPGRSVSAHQQDTLRGQGAQRTCTVLATLLYPCPAGTDEGQAGRRSPTIDPLTLSEDGGHTPSDRLAFVVTFADGDGASATDYLMVPGGVSDLSADELHPTDPAHRVEHRRSDGVCPPRVQLGPCQCSAAVAGIRTNGLGEIVTRFEWKDRS